MPARPAFPLALDRALSLIPFAASLLTLLLTSHLPAQDSIPSIEPYAHLAPTSTWTEALPDTVANAGASPETRSVTARIWNPAIQAALAARGSVHLPKQPEPYYLDGPIILKSGQTLRADRDTEIRLKPHTNTCMVRNEHVLGFADQPVPADTQPDTDITIEGGIWTTLSTRVNRANGNLLGRTSTQSPVYGTHGVILLQNVRRVTVRNVTVRRSTAFAVHLANAHEFTVDGVRLDQHGRDGVHVNGPASHGLIRDLTGDSHDDPVSLCAWDWKNCAPSFGPIHHITVEKITGVPLELKGTDAIRLLPGVKRFSDGSTLDCPIHDIVLRDIRDIREFKLYDQPNLELGRDNDSSAGLGHLRNIILQRLTFTRPGVIQVAAHVDGLHIADVDLTFPHAPDFHLVEIGPMSGTYRHRKDDPTTWVELFSPDQDVTVRSFSLKDVRVKGQPVTDAAKTLVKLTDQTPNPDYPNTTPRGGTGKVRVLDGK